MYKFNSKEHIHTLNDKPLIGTTSAISEVLAKNGLTWWASSMAVGTLGWSNPKKTNKEERIAKVEGALEMIKALDKESYLQLLDKAYQAHNERKETAAEDGTDLHAEIEKYIKVCIDLGTPVKVSDNEHWSEKAKIFSEWAVKNVKQFVWSEMHCYSRTLWLGGISDFGYITNDDELFIGDIKSSKEAYFSQFIQTALYQIQIEENGLLNSDGVQVQKLESPIKGYAIFPFGNGFTEPTIRYASDEWKEAAEGVVKIYKLLNSTK